MSKSNFLLRISLLLLLGTGCLALRRDEKKLFIECQLERLNALEPDHRAESEAGVTESWSATHPELLCVGVAVVRRTLYTNSLHLPSYSNGAQMHFIVQGTGVLGAGIPGCAATFEEPLSQSREKRRWWMWPSQRRQQQPDSHQKLRHIEEGDIVAIPVGIPYWTYNNGDSPLVTITLVDMANEENQLGRNPLRFYLAGNPEEEHPEAQQGKHRMQQKQRKNNMLSGFETQLLVDALNVDEEIVRNLQSQEKQIDQMITVRGGLSIMSSQSQQTQQEEGEEQRGQSQQRHQGQRGQGQQEGQGRGNALEETLCNLKIHQNIGDPSQADFYNPRAGRISTTNILDLPILNLLRLSAEHVVLYSRGMYAPHWNINANSIIYVTRGTGRVQVVNSEGKLVFDGELRRGQLLMVPQNFAVAYQAGNEGFEYIAFKTHERAKIIPLGGRDSFFEATPAEVLANVFGLRPQQLSAIKHARDEGFLLSPASQSQEPFSVKV